MKKAITPQGGVRTIVQISEMDIAPTAAAPQRDSRPSNADLMRMGAVGSGSIGHIVERSAMPGSYMAPHTSKREACSAPGAPAHPK